MRARWAGHRTHGQTTPWTLESYLPFDVNGRFLNAREFGVCFLYRLLLVLGYRQRFIFGVRVCDVSSVNFCAFLRRWELGSFDFI